MSLLVAKLGGSLAQSPRRNAWLAALAASRQPLILVPGGGPLAQVVRAEQARMGFDDIAAHRLALLAMEQFAIVLAGHCDRFVLASTRRDIEAVILAQKIPVWLPCAMALRAREIPASWDATSDSLSAWLAGHFAAARLLLIKSCDVGRGATVRELAANNIVDPLFPRFAAQINALIFVAGPASLPSAKDIIKRDGVPGEALLREAIEVAAPAPA